MVPAITGYPGCPPEALVRQRVVGHLRAQNSAVRGIETDYLVVGAGAAGMAFVDALIAECDADVLMVDGAIARAVTGTTRTRSCACTARRRCTA